MAADTAAPRPVRPGRTPSARPGRAGGKRDENRQRRTRAISDAALKLFLAHGIELVTIDDIVQEAQVAKGSFYRYFQDKTELVAALLAPLAENLRGAFANCERALEGARSGDPLSKPYFDLAADLTTLAIHDADRIRLYLQECRAPAVGARRPIAELATEIHERAIALSHTARRHRLTRETDPRLTATAVVGAVEHLIFRFLSGDLLGSTDDVPNALITLVLDGVRGDGR